MTISAVQYHIDFRNDIADSRAAQKLIIYYQQRDLAGTPLFSNMEGHYDTSTRTLSLPDLGVFLTADAQVPVQLLPGNNAFGFNANAYLLTDWNGATVTATSGPTGTIPASTGTAGAPNQWNYSGPGPIPGAPFNFQELPEDQEGIL